MKQFLIHIFRNSALVFILFTMFACCEESVKDMRTTSEQIVDAGGAGSFKAINLSTNDTLSLSGSIINVGLSKPQLRAKNGNTIKLIFEPAEKYAGKYSFSTTYILLNGEKIENAKGYEFTITDTTPGEYDIFLSAASTEQAIIASSSFSLCVTE